MLITLEPHGIFQSNFAYICKSTFPNNQWHGMLLNVHTPMHACTHTHVFRHACIYTCTTYMKMIKIKASDLYEKNTSKYIRAILFQMSEVNEESCLNDFWICIHLYTCITKIKAMDLHLWEIKYIIWVRANKASDEHFCRVMQSKKLRRVNKKKQKKTQIYLTTKETWHILCVKCLVVNEYDAHLSFHCVKLNKGRLRCTEISWKDELISDVSYQNVT